MANNKLTQAIEAYFTELRLVRGSGGATDERSLYVPLANLLNAVGGALKPKVFCVQELADQGAGHPDFGLYTTQQVQKGKPKSGQKPERGVVEVKPVDDDAWLTAESAQVNQYLQGYRSVLVTNARDFVLVGEDAAGQLVQLETFRLADSEASFDARMQHPRAFANEVSAELGEYLMRVLSYSASLADPKDLAWLLASYARDGLARVEAAGDAPSLTVIRTALEDSLGVRFDDERGRAFFRSTLVQTLFYGVFSAWVLWARQVPAPTGSFNWHDAVWLLRAPVLKELFFQLSNPAPLQALGLVEVLDWTAAALNRVDREAFFTKFGEGEAVPYFYEPFLQAFDPELRKQLGVWYTPAEVVRYMVARVDKALKADLGIPDGLAGENVYVLDPCCGTGAYLAEVLRRIAANLQGKGLGALIGAQVKQAATQRVFGFEIMPAPFVVAHLQVGLTMQELDAPLSEDGDERAGVFLTNALTGWESAAQQRLPFPELEEERERAERVKQDTPVLLILGNPPYSGFAGMAVEEERELSQAYGPPSKFGGPRDRDSTISTCGSSAWRGDALPRRPARAWFALSPTTRGWTACLSPVCGSTTSKPLTPSASTISTATASYRSTLPTDTPAKRSSHCKANPQASRWAPALCCYRRHQQPSQWASACYIEISTKRGPAQDVRLCWTVWKLPTLMQATHHWSPTSRLACHLNLWL